MFFREKGKLGERRFPEGVDLSKSYLFLKVRIRPGFPEEITNVLYDVRIETWHLAPRPDSPMEHERGGLFPEGGENGLGGKAGISPRKG
jgi:hypothetical protein